MKKWLLLFFTFSLIGMNGSTKGLAAEHLQAIIDAAKEGATIQLENKVYEGNLTIKKPIKIIGRKKTIIKGDQTGNVIAVHAPKVTLKHLTVINSSMNRNSSEEYAAIKLHSNYNVVDDIIIKHSYHGIYLSQSHHNVVQNVHITGMGKEEIAAQGNGIHMYYSNHNTLKNNEIFGARDGMFFDYSNDNYISQNKMSHNRYGLHYMYSDRNEFKDNLFTFNTGGATIMNSNNNRLSNNRFIFNYGHRSFGLFLLTANHTKVENNQFFLNQRGIYIDQSTNNIIRNNDIMNNQVGIELWASSNEQIFTKNRIHENTIPAVTLGGQGQNSWSFHKKGNDWGRNFPLLDLNQNRVGDQPVEYHSTLNELLEEQELTYLFLKSPAIAVYEAINKFLNNERVMFHDPYPLISN